MRNRKDIKQLYEEARGKHSELVELSTEVLDSLLNDDLTEYRRKRTGTFIILIILLPIIYVLFSVAGVVTWRLEDEIAAKLSNYDYHSMFLAVPGLQVGSVLGIFSVFVYCLISPVVGRNYKIGRYNLSPFPRESIFEQADYTSKRFITTAVVCFWVATGWGIVTAASFEKLSANTIGLALRIWMTPLGVVLSLSPIVLVMVFAAIAVWKESRRATTCNQVLRGLLNILSSWPAVESGEIKSGSFQRTIAGNLGRIAFDIKRLFFARIPSDSSQEWSVRQFALASDNLLVCASWLYLEQAHTIDSVRTRVVTYCNAFLTGHLHELPREEVAESQGLISLRPRQRLIRTIFLTISVLAYCMIPIAAFFLLQSRIVPLNVPGSIWLLTYSLWIVVGFYGYLEHTSQKGISVLVDLIKTILGR
jgi:hypothetical protein